MLFNLMVCRGNYAEILSGMGRRTEALAELQANLPQIEALVAASATSAHRYLLAYCCQSLGDILAAEQPAKALPYLQRARALSVRLAAETPTDPDRPYVLARSCASLGLALHRLEKYTAAQEAQQEGLATMDKLLRHHPHVPEYRVVRAGMACNLGLFFQLNEAPEKALPLYDQAIQELQRLLAQDPRMVKAHHYLANTYTNRAGVYDKLGRDKEALADWEAVLKLRPSPEIQFFRARSLLRLGRVEEGLTTLRQVLKADSDSFQRFTAARLWCLAAEKTQAQPQQAERYLQEARRLLQGLLADGYLQQPVTLNVLQTNPDFAILRQQKNGARSLPTPNSKE
jgi:tetratricopeptide (TPR) repeat protein